MDFCQTTKVPNPRYMPDLLFRLPSEMLRPLEGFAERQAVYMLRLDLIDPEISGNKLFKLHYYLEEAKRMGKTTLLTFGGAFSNHLLATAKAGMMVNLMTMGIVRGERPAKLSPTLEACEDYGMKIYFLSRGLYREVAQTGNIEPLGLDEEKVQVIPEGGYGRLGMKGASIIPSLFRSLDPTHVITAVGTATTLAGLTVNSNYTLIGIPVLKGMEDIPLRLYELTGNTGLLADVWQGYDHGGYAKYTPELLRYMNSFYDAYQVPTDFVYTGKMMYAVADKIKQGYFPLGSRIVCIHTGGLNGNRSLPTDMLLYKS
jgi:1-aminocyclopropane-1-carboxylate deaminase/D-cysteine desulfhydrase-like pyridoxal-dependent ACC family enzyme